MVHELAALLDRRDEAIRQDTRHTVEQVAEHLARMQQEKAALEGAWARLYVQVLQLRELIAKPFASESLALWAHQTIAALAAELWKLRNRLDGFDPPPPAGPRR